MPLELGFVCKLPVTLGHVAKTEPWNCSSPCKFSALEHGARWHLGAFPIPFYSTTLKLPSRKSTWIWKTNRFITFLDHLFPRESIWVFHAVSNVGLLEGIRYPLYRLYLVYFKSSFHHHFFRLNPILSIESSISAHLFRAWVAHPTIFQVKKMSPRDPTRTSHPAERSPSFRTLATSSWKVKVRSLAHKETHRLRGCTTELWCLCHGDEGSLDVHIYIYIHTICMCIFIYIYIYIYIYIFFFSLSLSV